MPKNHIIYLTRESVCMADDVIAPNRDTLTVPEGSSFLEILEAVIGKGCLASIQGGEATWIAKFDGEIVGVMAQQWSAPRTAKKPDLVDPPMLSGKHNLHFLYIAQEDPEKVYRRQQDQGRG